MYEILNNILYHMEGFFNFCFGDRVYNLILILFQMAVVALVIEIIGLFRQRKQDNE